MRGPERRHQVKTCLLKSQARRALPPEPPGPPPSHQKPWAPVHFRQPSSSQPQGSIRKMRAVSDHTHTQPWDPATSSSGQSQPTEGLDGLGHLGTSGPNLGVQPPQVPAPGPGSPAMGAAPTFQGPEWLPRPWHTWAGWTRPVQSPQGVPGQRGPLGIAVLLTLGFQLRLQS